MPHINGRISQVIGPVVDVYFEGDDADTYLPSIHDALQINRGNGKVLIVEVEQHIGENTVRTIAMDSTDGLQRGLEVIPTGGPITVPVGDQVKGRMLNVIGDVIDGMNELSKVGAKMTIRKITTDSANQDQFAITDAYATILENCIKRQPELWLWTHNRWKHKCEYPVVEKTPLK